MTVIVVKMCCVGTSLYLIQSAAIVHLRLFCSVLFPCLSLCITVGGPAADRRTQDRGFRQKLASREKQGDARGERGRDRWTGMSPSHQRPARSAKHAVIPAFNNFATVPEKDAASPDKEKERQWEKEKEKGKGINEIFSVVDRSRFWYKSVLILCTKLFICRQASRESIKLREVAMRRSAALLIVRVCQLFRGRRYAAMQMMILVRHGGAVKKLRLAVSAQT